MSHKLATGILLILCLSACSRTVKEAPASFWRVSIQGTELRPKSAADNCVDIAGAYDGFQIQASQPGSSASICVDTTDTRNLLVLSNVTILATNAALGDRAIAFEHEFEPGPNGTVVALTDLKGAFAPAEAAGVPRGDSVKLKSFFVQAQREDAIGNELAHQVGDKPETASFDLKGKKDYLAAASRTLKGVLIFRFTGNAHKLVLQNSAVISLLSPAILKQKAEPPAEPAAGTSPEPPCQCHRVRLF